MHTHSFNRCSLGIHSRCWKYSVTKDSKIKPPSPALMRMGRKDPWLAELSSEGHLPCVASRA